MWMKSTPGFCQIGKSTTTVLARTVNSLLSYTNVNSLEEKCNTIRPNSINAYSVVLNPTATFLLTPSRPLHVNRPCFPRFNNPTKPEDTPEESQDNNSEFNDLKDSYFFRREDIMYLNLSSRLITNTALKYFMS